MDLMNGHEKTQKRNNFSWANFADIFLGAREPHCATPLPPGRRWWILGYMSPHQNRPWPQWLRDSREPARFRDHTFSTEAPRVFARYPAAPFRQAFSVIHPRIFNPSMRISHLTLQCLAGPPWPYCLISRISRASAQIEPNQTFALLA
jgi:hypothetical protein